MLDKYYKKMIEEINDTASDKEQLLIIKELTKNLKDWQTPYKEKSIEEKNYIATSKILKIIEELEQEEKNYEK